MPSLTSARSLRSSLMYTASVASLFAAGEVGLWFDTTDITTLYQDINALTQVTAPGQTCALMLDKSKGLVLDSNILSTAWTMGFAGASTATNSPPGTIALFCDGTNAAYAEQSVATEIGVSYRVTLTTGTGNILTIAVGTTQGGGTLANLAAPANTAKYTFIFTATTTTTWIKFVRGAGGTCNITNISAQKIPGYHAVQPTAAQRPTYGVIPYGGVRNILTATDTLSTQTVSVGAITQTLSFTGTGTVVLSGAFIGSLIGTSASNQVSLTFTPTAGSLTLTVTGSVTFAQLEKGSSVTAYQKVTTKYNVTEAGKTSLGALFTDGIDDGMVTPSIDFSGTDKMTVWAGLQKMSDAAQAALAELTANPGIMPNSFSLQAPGPAKSYRFVSAGSATGSGISDTTAFPAPATSVLTGIGDISAPNVALRVNGIQVMQSTAAQGTGNYSNNPLYLFRRGGTTLPFNGIFTGLIVRGAASSEAQISLGNGALNAKLGAY